MNDFIPVVWGTEMSQYKVAFAFCAESKPLVSNCSMGPCKAEKFWW